MRHNTRVILITGAAGGIGRACAQAFSARGDRLALVDVSRPPRRLADPPARAKRPSTAFWQIDISDDAAVAKLFEQVIARFGRLDVLVNNAAVLMPAKPVENTTLDEMDRLLAVNVRGTFLCCKHAYAHLKKTRGCVVNVSSMAGIYGEGMHAAYSMTKGAINALTRSMAVDWGPAGIRCNAVCPSAVSTPNADRAIAASDKGNELLQRRQRIAHLDHVAQPREIASVVLFLASPAANYMTGALVPVSGGSECGYGLKY